MISQPKRKRGHPRIIDWVRKLQKVIRKQIAHVFISKMNEGAFAKQNAEIEII
jgi:hypothetical protein